MASNKVLTQKISIKKIENFKDPKTIQTLDR